MAATELYTRGTGETENRGESLVQQHLDRMQQQKETVAMDKLRLLMPQLGDVIRALALAKAEWDIDKAVNMLRSFQVAHLDKVNMMNKKRKKIREQMEAYNSSEDEGDGAAGDKEAAPSSSGGGGGSGSSSGGDSSDEEERQAKRQKSSKSKERKSSSSKKDKKKHKRSSKEMKRSKDSKSRDKKRKKRKSGGSSDDEAAARAKQKLSHTEDFGKFGYIRESDAHAKHAEFQLWCQEVKGANVELMGRLEEKELFRAFMEDYNTGTLPHRKYYDLEAHERSEALRAARERSGGDKPAKGGAGFDARADEEALRRERMEARRQFQQDRLNEAYNLLKHTDRAKDMREQELLRAEMALAYKTGDRAKAQKIFDRLQPDDQKK